MADQVIQVIEELVTRKASVDSDCETSTIPTSPDDNKVDELDDVAKIILIDKPHDSNVEECKIEVKTSDMEEVTDLKTARISEEKISESDKRQIDATVEQQDFIVDRMDQDICFAKNYSKVDHSAVGFVKAEKGDLAAPKRDDLMTSEQPVAPKSNLATFKQEEATQVDLAGFNKEAPEQDEVVAVSLTACGRAGVAKCDLSTPEPEVAEEGDLVALAQESAAEGDVAVPEQNEAAKVDLATKQAEVGVLESLSMMMDEVFGKDPRNVLRVINLALGVLVVVASLMIGLENQKRSDYRRWLEKSNNPLASMPKPYLLWLHSGFLILVLAAVFVINSVMVAFISTSKQKTK